MDGDIDLDLDRSTPTSELGGLNKVPVSNPGLMLLDEMSELIPGTYDPKTDPLLSCIGGLFKDCKTLDEGLESSYSQKISNADISLFGISEI